MTADHVAVVTPWYPSLAAPFRGAFVQAMVEATAPVSSTMTVFHCDEWVAAMSAKEEARVRSAYARLLPFGQRPGTTVGGAAFHYVPVALPRGLSYAQIALRHEKTLRTALRGRPIEAPVVHAHVGLPSGWAAMRNMRSDARLFVTEHATFLDQVLSTPDSRARYDEVISRSSGFLAVGEQVRAPLVEAFPHHADRIQVIPNPISFALTRAEPVRHLKRWLYIGTLIPRKGVTRLVKGFAASAADDPELKLTIAGSGPLQDELAGLARDLGVADRVSMAGSLPPEQALQMMREHDLLVHLSTFETFGMTVVEALAAGIPVLVTRCGGPEESLSGIESDAGELIPVGEDGDDVRSAYRRLSARLPSMNIGRARAVLESRYGYEAVAEAHAGLWFPEPAAAASGRKG
jgi:glycogen synthase